jgi:hypothetical protein
MKRVVVFIAIILVAGGGLFAKRHRANTVEKQLPPSVLTAPFPSETGGLPEPGIFADQVDLWGDPWVKTFDPNSDYPVLVSGNDHISASFEKIQPKLAAKTDSGITFQNQQLGLPLFDLRGLKLSLNLKPGYLTPDALLPNRIDPGVSGSFSF